MKPLTVLVTEAVLAGAKNMREVTAMIGHHIAAAQAMPAWRREWGYRQKRQKNCVEPPIKQQLKIGKQRIVSETLPRLVKRGKIVRIGKGVYGPPLPKLFVPSQAG